MKFAAGVLALLIAPPAALRSEPVAPVPDTPAQDWFADPILPAYLAGGATWPEDALTLEIPPLAALALPSLQEAAPAAGPTEAESRFPRAIDPREVQAWREEREVLRIREWSSDALFGVPLLFPQMAIESFLPRGIAVGPATFLYKSSSTSLPLVVLDQLLFHEAEFLANARVQADDVDYSNVLVRHQMRVLRKSLTGGFRASYAVPGLTMDQVLQTASEQGVLGYMIAPALGGAVLYFKGIDQKIRPHDDLRFRFKIASGRDWIHGVREGDGEPALNFEVRFFDLPVGIVGSFDISSSGLIPQFLGVGTSLDAVEDLLGREEALRNPEFRQR